MDFITHQVRLTCGTIGDVAIRLKPRELIGRLVLVTVKLEHGDILKRGYVAHVYEQGKLDL